MKKLLLIAAFILSCSEQPQIQNKIHDAGILSQKQGIVLVNAEPANLGQILNNNDSIETKSNSYATIELKNVGKISLKPNSKLSLHSYSDSIIEVTQSSGRTFSRVDHKGVNFKIITPTSVAAVRGTTFEVSATDKTTNIKLLEGKLLVIRRGDSLSTDPLIYLEPNEKIEVKDTGIEPTKKLTKYETYQLLKEDDYLDKEILPQAKAITPKLTLEDIKQKFGRVSKVTLQNGKEYIGYFTQSGNIMTIITVNGTFKVKTTEIAKVIVVD